VCCRVLAPPPWMCLPSPPSLDVSSYRGSTAFQISFSHSSPHPLPACPGVSRFMYSTLLYPPLSSSLAAWHGAVRLLQLRLNTHLPYPRPVQSKGRTVYRTVSVPPNLVHPLRFAAVALGVSFAFALPRWRCRARRPRPLSVVVKGLQSRLDPDRALAQRVELSSRLFAVSSSCGRARALLPPPPPANG
jgi:hypothetical protein